MCVFQLWTYLNSTAFVLYKRNTNKSQNYAMVLNLSSIPSVEWNSKILFDIPSVAVNNTNTVRFSFKFVLLLLKRFWIP